jgi:ABC-type sugar transport system substrate-binding protein
MLVVAVAAFAAGCGSDDDGGGASGSASSGSGSNKNVVAFTFASSETYIAAMQRGMKEAAAEAGLNLKIAENNFDAAQQNSQIQQELGSGSKPAAYVVQMADPGALSGGIASLAATGVPVFLVNQFPTDKESELMTAYAGVSDVQIGKNSAELLIQARDLQKERGVKLHSPGGNAVFIDIFPSVAASQQRTIGFTEGIKDSGINLISHAYGATDPSTGAAKMQALIAGYKSEGIDLVFAQNDAIAAGAMQALKRSGYHPGEDVMVVGANCRDDLGPLQSKEQFGTNLQGAVLEGSFAMDRVAAYLKNPKVEPGTYQAPADATEPTLPTTISKFNYIPSPPVVNTDVDKVELWGKSMEDWCSY